MKSNDMMSLVITFTPDRIRMRNLMGRRMTLTRTRSLLRRRPLLLLLLLTVTCLQFDLFYLFDRKNKKRRVFFITYWRSWRWIKAQRGACHLLSQSNHQCRATSLPWIRRRSQSLRLQLQGQRRRLVVEGRCLSRVGLEGRCQVRRQSVGWHNAWLREDMRSPETRLQKKSFLSVPRSSFGVVLHVLELHFVCCNQLDSRTSTTWIRRTASQIPQGAAGGEDPRPWWKAPNKAQ